MFQLFCHLEICSIPEMQQVTLMESVIYVHRKFGNFKFFWPLQTSIQRGVGQNFCICEAACVTTCFGWYSDRYKCNRRDDFDGWLVWELREIYQITQFVVKIRILVL